MNLVQSKETMVTYEPDNSIKKGYLSIFKEIFNELKSNQWLCYQLFKRDFLTLYKQSFFGIVWVFIFPLVSVGTFLILKGSGIFTFGNIQVPYPLYAILGIAFWQLFATGLIATSNSLVKAGPMIVKINFSKKSLVIASFGQAIVSFIIQIVFLGILFIYYQHMPSIIILFLPVLVLPIILFSLGLGFILSLLNGIFRDIGNALSLLMTFCMLLTPVLYAKPVSGTFADLTNYNILYYLICVPRNILLMGIMNSKSDWTGFFISVVLSLVFFTSCLVIFHLTETRIAERV
ncbi:MAG: ABC transporter permease [Candidatus Omnitrophica bacterium]|nr:ABC transporter permease [Candidatus Omnitrophota bacterium]